ncbi:MAG: aldehyde dehydrogenase family protein, partial [Pseudomonadota bacterium]
MIDYQGILKACGLVDDEIIAGDLLVKTPIDGNDIARLSTATSQDVDAAISGSASAFEKWRMVPAPRRGELVRLLGQKLREKKEALGALVTLECGKIRQEGLGEVQEMIDICDFAVGLSRQLYGLTIASERPAHTMREVWHPVGPCGI